jgi:hypothetical protein
MIVVGVASGLVAASGQVPAGYQPNSRRRPGDQPFRRPQEVSASVAQLDLSRFTATVCVRFANGASPRWNSATTPTLSSRRSGSSPAAGPPSSRTSPRSSRAVTAKSRFRRSERRPSSSRIERWLRAQRVRARTHGLRRTSAWRVAVGTGTRRRGGGTRRDSNDHPPTPRRPRHVAERHKGLLGCLPPARTRRRRLAPPPREHRLERRQVHARSRSCRRWRIGARRDGSRGQRRGRSGSRTGRPRVRPCHARNDVAPYVDLYFRARQWKNEPAIREPHKADDLCWAPLHRLPIDIISTVTAALACIDGGGDLLRRRLVTFAVRKLVGEERTEHLVVRRERDAGFDLISRRSGQKAPGAMSYQRRLTSDHQFVVLCVVHRRGRP